ncbi:DinB family protein [Pontibacter ruber]|uniref:DinB family protein n=1 Tax=Pontibacter ruber TaxID=1343895 RepID=A0ABW5D081_9BACT|nr:DinB family protein [Pontibacter ruber]
MNPRLEAKYLRLEKTRNRLLDELEGLEEGLLNTSPAEGKWSLNQVVAHLVLVDKLTTEYVERKVKQPEELPSASFSGIYKSILLKLVLKSGMKIQAPAVVATVPDKATLPSLRRQWDVVRFKLEDVLTEVPPSLLNKCVFKHPYAGYLTISQTLSFLQDHFDHHLTQVHHIKQMLLK